MKISGYYKSKNDNVTLILNWDEIKNYDLVYISKVFSETYIPEWVLFSSNVIYGGTGFYYDKAPPLPDEIEHCMPDYDLYNDWIQDMVSNGKKLKEFEYYKDYSIGFITKGCFRGCEFCVNKNCKKVKFHAFLNEFYDSTKKYICLLDDNILGYGRWEDIIDQLLEMKKSFQFKQGMDLRLITDKRAKKLANVKYKGDYIFAFDNIEDKSIIENKLNTWRTHCYKTTKLYVFCGFDRNENYDKDFYKQDIIDLFERIKILMKYQCLPYIMRHENYKNSPYKGTYINCARWCNQPNFFKKKSYREFCLANGENSSCVKYLKQIENDYPEIAKEYFDLKYDNLNILKKVI